MSKKGLNGTPLKKNDIVLLKAMGFTDKEIESVATKEQMEKLMLSALKGL